MPFSELLSLTGGIFVLDILNSAHLLIETSLTSVTQRKSDHSSVCVQSAPQFPIPPLTSQ